LKLLFDQNLSRKLPKKLADLYPDSSHVVSVGLAQAPDLQVRAFAARMDLSSQRATEISLTSMRCVAHRRK
jgi:predicted nuclease of predicted toxin-antitoxin system